MCFIYCLPCFLLQHSLNSPIPNHKHKQKHTNRYARWSLGFVDPPLSVIGTGSHCTISALNKRGQVLLSPILSSMNKLLNDGILSNVNMDENDGEGSISVEVSKAGEVGTFSEEERSRQVSEFVLCVCVHIYVYM